jgi:hypothetical protein
MVFNLAGGTSSAVVRLTDWFLTGRVVRAKTAVRSRGLLKMRRAVKEKR